ncbi:hypothetical protein K474DRAFT_1705947 [Panus rudis PR-1116 ss-1]|nr:hypothetical protein K474DRAFT_1705947 [Panus rudis PR-1116 ss-1]
MTSRLKRKLNDLGVDTSSSKVNENFCLIGTPLPPLEKTKDKNEFVPLWKQDVRDEKGRRRLHGAFTGGFSAGYFNTVGSKEGWTPSTFVSSRNERAKQRAARPEDFMDEEDLAELRESQQLVDEHEEMNFGGTEAELRKRRGEVDEESDPMAATLANALAPPPTESAGARILMKMGWRPGHGIGPRLTYEQRKAQDRAHGTSTTEDDDDEEAKKHIYPRRDTPLVAAPRKDNAHGLGYTPGISLNESLGRGKEPQGPRLSAGFGLGALNDADEDDLDVYDSGLGSNARNRVAYDVHDDDERITLGSSRNTNRQAGSRAPKGFTQTFLDGTPVLKGFVLSDRPVVLENEKYPFPEVPKGWKPDPRRLWDSDKNKENVDAARRAQQNAAPKSHVEWKESQLSADQRGSMLGETPLPSKPRSVFEYLSQKDKERLQNLREQVSSGQPASAAVPVPESQPTHVPGELDIPQLHPSVAKAALSGFKPFTADPLKQSRYTTFLTYASQADPDPKSLGIGPMPGQSIEEFNKELADYAKAAIVFKPLSGAMAGRFRSAAIVESGPKIIEGLHTPENIGEANEDDKQEKKEEKPEDPRMDAVKLGMYGHLTREVKPWQPARLLCKRFGVKDPEVDLASAMDVDAPANSQTSAPSGSGPPALADLKTITAGTGIEPPKPEEETRPRSLANIGMGEDETQGRDTLTYVRPSMDVFKAIFASDDEDSDDEAEDAPPKVDLSNTAVPAPPESKPSTQDATTPKPVQTSTTIVEKIDMNSFKPTFVPRSDRESRKDRPKEKKEKQKKSSKPALVSFDDEEGLQVTIKSSKRDKPKDQDGERKKKKRKEKEKQDVDEDESMWVEAPPPEIVQQLETKIAAPTEPEQSEGPNGPTAGPPRGRKRAIDFM